MSLFKTNTLGIIVNQNVSTMCMEMNRTKKTKNNFYSNNYIKYESKGNKSKTLSIRSENTLMKLNPT